MIYCIICRSGVDNELRLGKFHTLNNVHVHERCLYLSSNLSQRYNSKFAILHFDIDDIKAEAERVKKLSCCYCSKKSANIGCCHWSCRRTFHTDCGNLHGAQYQFKGKFESFCKLHVHPQEDRPDPHQKCAICFDMLIDKRGKFSSTNHIHGECCNNGWYHKTCLQQYANSSGYFFKCPLCNDSKKFGSVVLWGISVPLCDASWENTSMYEDQTRRETKCSARRCVNPDGREADNLQLLYCCFCGSIPMHSNCMPLKYDKYYCDTCSEVVGMANAEDSTDDDLDPIEKLIATQTPKQRRAPETCGNTGVTKSASYSNKNGNILCSGSDSDIDWEGFKMLRRSVRNKDINELKTDSAKQETTTITPYSLRNKRTDNNEATPSNRDKKEKPPSEIVTEKEKKQPGVSVQAGRRRISLRNQIANHSVIASRTRGRSTKYTK
ncbi:PHD finger protein 7 [Drosophila grimshawi]|uniref:GH24325 n=1 Tax=Drosophila grimshawi TaxID=7222 RepID=B4JMI0_DROGR|nr:PHD finger protein 7 [Drosophila grimshawi]EDV91923.1 GH24325 [Drosophila grimshawi]